MSYEYNAWAYINLGAPINAASLSVNTSQDKPLQVSNIRQTDGLRMFLHLSNNPDDLNMEFYFPYSPAQMQITDLSSNYVEIDRPKNIPIVEFAGHKLMKFQIEFLLSHIGNGVSIPVDSHIEFLRKMATSKQGIGFTNGNSILSTPLQYKGTSTTSTKWFYITDMSVNAQRMTYDNKGIAAASVSLSFTETRNPVLDVLTMPKIKYTPNRPRPGRGGGNPNNKPQTSYTQNEQTTTANQVGSKKTTKKKKKK